MSEILAPAGNESSAFAAINAGADAVYLGLEKFSARGSSENFNVQKLENICKYAHAFGVKIYVALNTVVKDVELDEFLNCAVGAWNAGADALILQDIFLGKYLKRNFPAMRLHLSTQAGTCNVLGAHLAKEYGFDRVILARETKLSDIGEISKIIETEAFVQGALCTCFSGQCYLSSFIGGNSGNRGLCKQPCRKRYSIDEKGYSEPAYRLSLSDLCVGEKIADYISAGVVSFKIEGRMRRPEYVAAAVKYYKTLLKGQPADKQLADLKRTFNRGNYTCGLAFGQDKSFISSAVQGHIGEYAGIIKVENSKYILPTHLSFSVGDGFKILRDGKEVGGGLLTGTCRGGYILSSKARLKNGDKAFITTDNALTVGLLSEKRFITVNVKVELFAEKRAKASIEGIACEGETLLECAKNRPLSAQDIVRCFEKTDGYPFLPQIEVQTDGIFMRLSELNALRRSLYENYFDKLSANGNIRYDCSVQIPSRTPLKNTDEAVIGTNLVGVKARYGILKPSDYSTPFSESPTKGFSGEKYLFIPPFASGEDVEKIAWLAKNFDGIYCDNYFGMELAKRLRVKFFAGTGFNIANRLSLDLCEADCVCISKELTLKEADALSDKNVFYLSEGGIKVMDLIYCPFGKKCSTCENRGDYTLCDEDGRKFPLRRYRTAECAFELYNCAQLIPCSGKAGRLTDSTVEGRCEGFTRGHSINGIN